jgi:hypothetical protein
VITSEPVTGFRAPTVVVADRWGEIIHETVAPEASMLPSGEDLLVFLHAHRRVDRDRVCADCSGEPWNPRRPGVPPGCLG